MKKRNILLGIAGVFLLASCGTEKPYIRPNNDNVTPNGGASNPETVVPEMVLPEVTAVLAGVQVALIRFPPLSSWQE